MNKEPELLSCPFCGRPPKVVNNWFYQNYIIECDYDGCPTKPKGLHYQNKDEAIKIWNTRTTPQPKPFGCNKGDEILPKSSHPILASEGNEVLCEVCKQPAAFPKAVKSPYICLTCQQPTPPSPEKLKQVALSCFSKLINLSGDSSFCREKVEIILSALTEVHTELVKELKIQDDANDILTRQNNDLQHQLQSLLRDKERLDWLDKNPTSVVSFQETGASTLRIYCDKGMFYGKSLREAIDVAIQQSEKKEER